VTQDEREDAIFLAMLAASRADGTTLFDLQSLCRDAGISHTINDLLAFTRLNHPFYGDSSRSTLNSLRFEISSEGLRRAREIEASRQPLSISDRLANDKFQKIGNLSISALSLLISIGALVVATIALYKGV
jgi:hypothetical protein